MFHLIDLSQLLSMIYTDNILTVNLVNADMASVNNLQDKVTVSYTNLSHIVRKQKATQPI